MHELAIHMQSSRGFLFSFHNNWVNVQLYSTVCGSAIFVEDGGDNDCCFFGLQYDFFCALIIIVMYSPWQVSNSSSIKLCMQYKSCGSSIHAVLQNACMHVNVT